MIEKKLNAHWLVIIIEAHWIIRVVMKLCVLELYKNIHSNTRNGPLKTHFKVEIPTNQSKVNHYCCLTVQNEQYSSLDMGISVFCEDWVERWLTSVPSAGVCLGHCPMGTRPSLIHLQQKRRMFLLLFSQPFSVLSREVLGWLFISSILIDVFLVSLINCTVPVCFYR